MKKGDRIRIIDIPYKGHSFYSVGDIATIDHVFDGGIQCDFNGNGNKAVHNGGNWFVIDFEFEVIEIFRPDNAQ